MIRRGQGGKKVYKGGKNIKQFGSEWALMCGRMKAKGALSWFLQKKHRASLESALHKHTQVSNALQSRGIRIHLTAVER